MLKSFISILLAVMLTVSMVSVAVVNVSAEVDDENRYYPEAGLETYRYYFYMPSDWYNEYASTAGIYWWLGTDACPSWPGYHAQPSDVANVYYCDVPQDVPIIIWNNGIDGGDDDTSDIFAKSIFTVNIGTEYYDKGESDLYPNGTDNFNNMIYVLDPDKLQVSAYNGKRICGGEWYYYYGNGEYGVQPTKAEAEEVDALYNTDYQPPKKTIEPEKDELTVKTTSNFFTSQTATYNNRTNKLVVTYYIQAEKDLLNTQWEMTYDPTVLSVSKDVNTKDSICPSFTTNNAVSINDGVIKFNTYNLSLFDISREEKIFARVEFDVNDFEALGIYGTTIDLNVMHLTVSALDSSTCMTDENEEVKIVYNGKYNDADSLIVSERIEMINSEIPKYIGDVDNSGVIDIHDATDLAKHVAAISMLTEEKLFVADCDGDGIISVKDITCIQLYVVDAVNYGNTGNTYELR